MASARNPVSVLLKLMKRNYKKLTDARETFEVISNRMGVLDNPQELVAFLGQHLKPKELEKKQNGEVFTPPDLIQQKFNKLTLVDPQIWSDPSKKFLDPANGIGNYPALAFHRLMEGLKDAIPNEANRKKHILENMLYMCELNKKNIEVSRKLFDPENHYKLNLYQGSYLDFSPKEEWGVEKFDVIMGNPPYNAPNKDGKSNGNTLYPKFIIHSTNLLMPGGYQIFVHPGIWRKPGNKLHDCMFGRQIMYLEIHTKNEGKELFNATTRYEWYILKNIEPCTETEIRFDDGVVEKLMITKDVPMLVNHGYSIWKKVSDKAQTIGEMKVICGGSEPSGKCTKTSSSTNMYPCVNSTQKTKGVVYLWSKKLHKHQYDKKVIFATNEIVVPFFDEGKFGLTQHGLYQLVKDKEEGEMLCRFLSSKLIKYIVAASKWSMFQTEYETFRHIPLIKDLPNSFTDTDVYEYFGLTPEEITRIDKNHHGADLSKYKALEAPKVIVPPPSVVVSETVAQPVVVATTTLPDYKKMKVADLKQLCKDRKIKGITGKSKEELIAMLTA
jgi:Eco57I restriction-modification methylase